MIPLGLLSSGEKGEVVKVFNGHHRPTPELHQCCQAGQSHRGECRGSCRMEDMGLRIGKQVEMLNNGGHGCILIKIGEARIALDRGLAMKIMVIPQSDHKENFGHGKPRTGY